MPEPIDRLALEIISEVGREAALDEALRRCGKAVDEGSRADVNRMLSVIFALDRKLDPREQWKPVAMAAHTQTEQADE